jgi:hypothetical protein
MRFKPIARYGFEDTRRKKLAALRSEQRQRDSLPLLAEIIRETQPEIDQLMTKRAEDWASFEQTKRDQRAALWRRGRRKLATYDAETRRAILTYWNNDRWLPGDPSYFSGVMHRLDRGRLIRDGQTLEAVSITISMNQCIDVIERTAPASKAPALFDSPA